MDNSRSEELFARAQKVTPGGVNSPVRAFRGVGGTPRFIARGEGSRLIDVDGNSYIDYICSWGPLLLGHRPKPVIEALQAVLEIGTSFGAPTEREIELGRADPRSHAEHGTGSSGEFRDGGDDERSSRRPRVHRPRPDAQVRGLLSRPRRFAARQGRLGNGDTRDFRYGRRSESFAATTIVVPFNDLDAVEAAFREQGDRIACVIVEPVVGNMGCVPPQPGFLEGLRAVTERHGSLLIFDEVMTGFRLAFGGAQQLYGITAGSDHHRQDRRRRTADRGLRRPSWTS